MIILQYFFSLWTINKLYHQFGALTIRWIIWWTYSLLISFPMHYPNNHMIFAEANNMSVFKHLIHLHLDKRASSLAEIAQKVAVKLVIKFDLKMPLPKTFAISEDHIAKFLFIQISSFISLYGIISSKEGTKIKLVKLFLILVYPLRIFRQIFHSYWSFIFNSKGIQSNKRTWLNCLAFNYS